MPAAANTRGVSGITLTQFFTAVLQGLGAPVTPNNLAKLGAVAATEGHGGSYNPFNYVVPSNGSTMFNHIAPGVGVQNYPDVQTGIAMTIRLLSGNRGSLQTARSNLMSDGAYNGFTGAFSDFYRSWGGGAITVNQQTAAQKLNGILDGPPVSGGAASLGSGANPSLFASTSATPAATQGASAMNAQPERDAFEAYLKSVGADQAGKIINSLKSGMSLQELSRYMSTAPPEVNRYINFLASLDTSGQNAEKNMLVAPDAQGSADMTNMLQKFGISYSNAPNPTPALLAFLNGIGLNLSTAEDVKNRALERIGAATSDAMADIDRSAGRNKQNITADLVRRGVLSSGESNTRYARQAADVADQQSGVQRTAANSSEDVNNNYRQAQDLARQTALDRIIGAEQDQSTARAASSAQEDAYRRQQAAAEAANSQSLAAQQANMKAQEELMAKQAAQGFAG